MNGFWGGRSERCYVDVRVLNPYAPSYVSSLSASYKWHEKIKLRAYGQRIREVQHGSFTPIVLSATGGMAQEATMFYKRLASLLATKWNDDYDGLASLLPFFFAVKICNSLCLWCPFLFWACL